MNAQRKINHIMSARDGKNKAANGGLIHISEDVIIELARKTIQGIQNIKVASKFASKFGLGRKNTGIRVSVDHSQGNINVDAYVLVKFGQRIPDLAWDIQEKIKDNLERYTGYNVKAVNVSVQGIYAGPGDNYQVNIELPPQDEEAE
ncbi:MAG: Asp23/Gls24 family envelope stress response protein [Synergistaceae bacterium]|nr:Asp23/Gls24 family envelope stress response protein [Synergistaceae bacterium]